MTDSLCAKVICIVDDSARRAQISRELRDAGFSVVETSTVEDSVQMTQGLQPALVFRDAPVPTFLMISAPDGTSGETGSRRTIEVVLADQVEPPVLVSVARALLELHAAHASLRFADADSPFVAPGSRQAPGFKVSPLDALFHGLRTPLSAMLGRLYMMQTGKLGDADMKRAIEKLQNNVREQVQLIDQLQSVSRTQP